jgi:hypothetical protein
LRGYERAVERGCGAGCDSWSRQRNAKEEAKAKAAAAIDDAQKMAAQLEQIAGAKELAYELQGLLEVSLCGVSATRRSAPGAGRWRSRQVGAHADNCKRLDM